MPFFRKKKKEEKPELPELPSFAEIQQIKRAVRPESSGLGGIKVPEIQETSVRTPTLHETPEVEEKVVTRKVLTHEISEPIIQNVPETQTEVETPVVRTKKQGKVKEPLFVKIDKFKEALSNFETVKEKLREIDELLKKIKETRIKEQEEFNSWEKEVNEIKDRIEDIDERLFSKIE